MAEPQVDSGTSTSTAGAPTPPPAEGTPSAGSEFEPKGFRGTASGQLLNPEDTLPEEEQAQAEGETETERRVVGRGGEIPAERIAERVARGRKAERAALMKEFYGTDDEKEIDRIKAERATQAEEHKKLTSERTKRERSEMTELAKAKADLTSVQEKNKRLQDQIKEASISVAMQKQDTVVMREATTHVAPKYQKYARRDLADHVRVLSAEDQATFDERKLGRWFARYVRDNPEFAIKAEAAPAPAPKAVAKPVPRRKAISSPKPPRQEKAAGSGSVLAGKTPRPGQPNSMDAAELKLFMKEKGHKPW